MLNSIYGSHYIFIGQHRPRPSPLILCIKKLEALGGEVTQGLDLLCISPQPPTPRAPHPNSREPLFPSRPRTKPLALTHLAVAGRGGQGPWVGECPGTWTLCQPGLLLEAISPTEGTFVVPLYMLIKSSRKQQCEFKRTATASSQEQHQHCP